MGTGGERLFEFDWEEEGVGAYLRLGAFELFLPLFKVGANLRLGAYSNKYGILMSLDCLRFKYSERELKEIHLSLDGHLWTFQVMCRFGSD